MTHYWMFLGVSILIIVTPGPDTILTIRNTLLGGRAGGIGTALGVTAGQLIWACTASLGMVALLVTWEPLFAAVKYGGALYLIYLGIQALRSASRPNSNSVLGDSRTSRPISAGIAFRQGMISNLGNPKMVVFFATLLPQFAPVQGGLAHLLLLGAIFSALTLSWLALYAVLLPGIQGVLRRPRYRRALEALMGAVLVTFGLRLALERA